MEIVLFAIIHIALLIFYGVFGMTLLPDFGRRIERRNAFFLASPLIGAGVWLSVTVGLGCVLPYNALFLCTFLFIALIWIFIRKKTLFLPENPCLWCFPLAIIVVSAIISRGIAPTEINGGLYFPPSIYDHIKCAIINSISSHGLPPVNPWLSDNGQSLPLVYYFGWHAWAAQLPILTGCGIFWTECAMTGFTFAVVLTGIAGFLAYFSDKKHCIACLCLLLVLIFFDTEYTNIAEMVLPKSWMSIFHISIIAGFWNIFDSFIWSPQHLFSAAMVILILVFHDILLHSGNRNDSATCATLIGFFAAAAVLTSIYAGAFALLAIGAMMIFDYCSNRDFRQNFNRTLGWQISAVLLCLVLTALYLKFLFAYPPEDNPLAFGMMPCFGTIDHFWKYPTYFAKFYLSLLPLRCGLIYIFGMLAIFWPGVLPNHPLMNFCKKYTVVCFLLIFFIHSTFYSNDFGWRFPTAPQLLLTVFAAFFLYKAYSWLMRTVKCKWCIAVITAIFIIVGAYYQYNSNFALLKYDPSLHRVFARAIPGWKVIQTHTSPDDLVLCNPAGFYEIGKIHVSTQSTNVFFSLFSERNTPIADLIFAKCYSEYYPQEKLEALYEKVVAIFAGNPSPQDADYLADDLKVCAILVTPLDGLWNNPGEIENRFPMKVETPNYRVYWREE